MAENLDKQKTIELWEGFVVPVNERLLDDVDFITDFNDAIQTSNLTDLIEMTFALVGGQETYDAAREHIVNTCGRFSMKELDKIIEKVGTLFPKAGNRAMRRHKWTQK